MSDASAIRLLQTAIENVRETCTGPEYKTLLAACAACDRAADDAQAHDEAEPPRTLKQASERARTQLKAKNAASYSSDSSTSSASSTDNK